MVNTVSVICPCGKPFDREVRRGRPQVWCPACIAVPFAERVRVEIVEGEVVADAAPRNPNDKFWRNRDAIEAGVAEVNASYQAAAQALIATGVDPWASAEFAELSIQNALDLRAVYAQFRPDTASKVEAVEAADAE